ncbi:hypothetical protein SS1G_08181 [Sclerotinia sclerotiorum 1980 UF-70]|uniref:Post-SET domain-containing protein n=2 Tax=Sclerotinia sclerotiorum (strain ATCC 18683 / 1980 / Ss-1) TaxID=665079 RepID=A7ES76_SCLS1|nr:hypothetical protein SS1G_08181 [Sclerotinia sclerotiorum 1980 UF-70]APA12757.1 hypothetical protein sscle_10g075270 [Sclerotinia sclerotiorum 1980 UF-70]EDN92318.1 hypothetical protein SS1G_08181 [Sclerotinia sclerotiorum 1980 UF-70]
MAPVKPFWSQPSHPHIQEVIYGEDENGYTTKSISRVSLPPYAVFAKMEFPPCTSAPEATYATVQTDTNTHLNLNSDLLYINHSCEPSLIFDVQNQHILTSHTGLQPGQELTFFYPSTEWKMSQSFSCNCGTASCVGEISGAGQMSASALEGKWLSAHIRRALEERGDGNVVKNGGRGVNGENVNGVNGGKLNGGIDGQGEINGRRGVTSREMSGEMGGDTL